MKKIPFLVLLAFLGSIFIGAATYKTNKTKEADEAPPLTVKITKNAVHGDILTDSDGMTLYIFTPDTKTDSKCYGKCAKAWPPLLLSAKRLASSLGGKLSAIPRRDTIIPQLTYDGKPLYYFIKDKNEGDTKGHRIGGKWYVAKLKRP